MTSGFHYVIGILVAFGAITGLMVFHTEILGINNRPVDPQFLEIQGIVNQTLIDAGQTQANMEEKAKGGSNVQDSTIDAPKAALEAAVVLLSFPKVVIASVGRLADAIGLPAWVIGFLIMIIVFATVFIVVSYLRGKDL